VHFILAQIYEAKGDRTNEMTQLREYLKLVTNLDDAALAKQYLSQLEQSAGSLADRVVQAPAGKPDAASDVPARENAKTEIAGANSTPPENGIASRELDRSVSDDASSKCNLDDVLPEVESRVREFVSNVQDFTATESFVQESFNASGKVARSQRWSFNYVVSIEDSVPGLLGVKEYQSTRSSETAHPDIVTKGLPALLLIFHPYYAGDFSMHCESLAMLHGTRTWQIRFRQRDDKPSRIRSYKMGTAGNFYELALEGRAWFLENNYQIVKLEANLVKPIPEIQLTVDHTSAEYGPVHFQSRGIDIWLPQTVDFRCVRKGRQIHERIAFSDYLLFSVDNKQQIASPKIPEQKHDFWSRQTKDWPDLKLPFSGDIVWNLQALPVPD
jgi:hypothetical protein